MNSVTLSSKYQIVIPREVRERNKLKPGMRLQVICFNNRIELVPIRPARELLGFMEGFDPTFERDEEDRI